MIFYRKINNPPIFNVLFDDDTSCYLYNIDQFNNLLCTIDPSGTTNYTFPDGSIHTLHDIVGGNFEEGYNFNYIPDNFLWSCRNFNHIINIPASVTTIGIRFMISSQTTYEIKFENINNITSIGKSFLTNANNITNFDLEPLLQNLTSINDEFCCGMTKLKHNIMIGSKSKLKNIGNRFFINCKNIKYCDISLQSKIETIGNSFLEGCTGLYENVSTESMRIQIPSTITSIGTSFMTGCNNFYGIIDYYPSTFVFKSSDPGFLASNNLTSKLVTSGVTINTYNYDKASMQNTINSMGLYSGYRRNVTVK